MNREAIIEIEGVYSSKERQDIEQSYENFCEKFNNKSEFTVSFYFKEDNK